MPTETDDLIMDTDLRNPVIKTGLILAERSLEEGGWKEYLSETDDGDYRIEDPYLRSSTALMLENTKEWAMQKCGRRRDSKGRLVLNEATRSSLIGGFSDYLFPLIRAAFPTNAINDLVSVQPTNRRIATVVFWNWIYASTKGSITAGQRMFDANIGKPDASYHYSDNIIDVENTGTASSTSYTGTLTYNDGGGVIPGTVVLGPITLSDTNTLTLYDNGNGNFVANFSAGSGTFTSGSSSINYATGVFTIVIAVVTFNGVVNAGYQWNSEGSALTPQVDVQIITSTSETQRRALRLNYSMEAMFDVNAEFGVDLEPNLLSGAAEQLNYEIARQLVAIMWNVAAVVTTFPTTPTSGYISLQQHFMDLIYYLTVASNTIWANTQKAYGNWIIVDALAANIIESMANTLFERPGPAQRDGHPFHRDHRGSISRLQGRASEQPAQRQPLREYPDGIQGRRLLQGGIGLRSVPIILHNRNFDDFGFQCSERTCIPLCYKSSQSGILCKN